MPTPNTPALDDSVAELLRTLAIQLLDDVDRIAGEVSRRVAESVSAPAALDESAYLDVLRRSTTVNIEALFSSLAYGIPPTAVEPPDGALELVDHVACDAHGLPVLLRIYRIGAAQTWQQVARHLGEEVDDATTLSALILVAGERLNDYADHVVQCLTERWDERRLDVAQRGLQRDALIRALMRGETIDVSALDYPFERYHVAVATRSTAERVATQAGPVHTIGHRFPGVPSLRLNAYVGIDIVWLSFDVPPSHTQLDDLARSLHGRTSAGISAVAQGVDGFTVVAHEAHDTLNTVTRLHPSGGVATFHGTALITTLLAASPSRTRRFAEVVLGPLAQDGEEAERLRATLRAYYACGASKIAASSTLSVHEKTVAYRLRQASRLLGQSIDTNRVDIEAALAALAAEPATG